MSEIIIEGVTYDTDDRIALCPDGSDWYYNAPYLANLIELTDSQKDLFNATLLGFAFCPSTNKVEVWEGVNRTFVR